MERITPTNEPKEQTPAEVDNPSAEAQNLEDIKLPDNWEQPVKDFFNSDVFKDNAAGKKVFFDKFKSLEDGYQKKFNDFSEKEKEFNARREAFDKESAALSAYRDFEKAVNPEDLREIYSQFGGIAPYLSRLYQLDRQFSQDPIAFLQGIMSSSGITPQMLLNGAQDPQYQQLAAQRRHSQELGNLEQKMLSAMEKRFQAEAFEREVIAFAKALDGDGKPLHPHIEQVGDMMDLLMANNPHMSLEDAYQNACYAVPQVREQVLKAQADKIAAQKAVQEDLNKAKKAQGLNSFPKTANSKQNKNWEQTLDDLLDKEFGDQED